jgi:hypothetical protein
MATRDGTVTSSFGYFFETSDRRKKVRFEGRSARRLIR